MGKCHQSKKVSNLATFSFVKCKNLIQLGLNVHDTYIRDLRKDLPRVLNVVSE